MTTLFDKRDVSSNDALSKLIHWHFREDLGCLIVNCAVDPDEFGSLLDDVVGGSFPRQAGTLSSTSIGRLLWLTPRSWLLQCALAEEQDLAAQINKNFSDKRVHAVQIGDGLCWFELSGVGAPSLLAEGSFLSLDREGLRVGCVKRVVFASVPMVIVREREDTWLVGIERSRTRYVTDWIRSAVLRANAMSSDIGLE